MKSVHANAGCALSCPSGHPVALFTRTVFRYDIYREGDLEFIHYDTPEVGSGDPVCAVCGDQIYWNNMVCVMWPGTF